jgi:hypothetical protein
MPWTSRGSLPGLRTGTNPADSDWAIAVPKMKPRLSAPTTSSHALAPVGVGHQLDRERQRGGITEQRGHVLERHARLGEVGDVEHQAEPSSVSCIGESISGPLRVRARAKHIGPVPIADPGRARSL